MPMPRIKNFSLNLKSDPVQPDATEWKEIPLAVVLLVFLLSG